MMEIIFDRHPMVENFSHPMVTIALTHHHHHHQINVGDWFWSPWKE
jgi:hypothetical protein